MRRKAKTLQLKWQHRLTHNRRLIITLTNGGDTVCKGYFYRNLRKNDLPDIERGKLLAEVLDVSLDDLVRLVEILSRKENK